MKHALKDLNPRHLVLETNVLPTELRTLYINKNLTILMVKVSDVNKEV